MIRLHTSSSGLDPAALVPGRDLVLSLHPAHGVAAPGGTYVMDHLDPAGRAAADAAAVRAHDAWRASVRTDATADGVDWAFVWMLPVHSIVNGAVTRALALRAALRALSAGALRLADADPAASRLAAAVAAPMGLEIAAAPDARAPQPPRTVAPPLGPATRARRRALGALSWLGAPSHLQAGSVAFHAYWPLEPLLDRMLADPGRRPAVFLDKRPRGARRTLRAARRGGWVGLPTPSDRRRARPGAERVVAAVRAHDRLTADGLELGPAVAPQLAALARARAVEDLAQAAVLRRALRHRRPDCVIGCYDVAPAARLVVLVAKEAGIRTVMLSHGAFVLPQPFGDLDVCDEVLLWTRAVAPAMTNWARPIHEVGYPLPHAPPPPTRRRPRDRPPVIGVLGQLPVSVSCTLDDRVTMRAYDTALRAIAARFPDATVLLRPHPAQDRAATPAIRARFPDLDVREAGGGDIVAFMERVDLCLGSASTATLQAPLGGAAVAVLNVSGTEWRPPLGHDTAVPVARSTADLDAVLARWEAEDALPGGEDLLRALGASGGDAVERILAVLDRRPAPAAAPRSPTQVRA